MFAVLLTNTLLICGSTAGPVCTPAATYRPQVVLSPVHLHPSRFGAWSQTTFAKLRRTPLSVSPMEFLAQSDGQDLSPPHQTTPSASSTYDELLAFLRPEIDKGAIWVRHRGKQLTIYLGAHLIFASGSAELRQEGLEVLRLMGTILSRAQGLDIRVGGHTDNVPISGRLQERFPTNFHLSHERATNAALVLEAGGLDRARMDVQGYGDSRPLASNASREGRQMNRRIEILLSPASGS